MSPRIAFRTDASTLIGAGHVVRSLALAQQLRTLGSDVHFVCREQPGHLMAMIVGGGFTVHSLAWTGHAADRSLGAPPDVDARQTAGVLETVYPAWLVTDHYAIDAGWERAAAPAGSHVAAIDDLADRPHAARLLVDQNLQPRAGRYDRLTSDDCRRLIGPRYALLRPGFAEAGGTQHARDGRLRRLLACAGGTDPQDLLGRVVEAWSALPSRPALDLVVGAASPNVDALRARCASLPDCRLHVQTERVAELMARADLIVCAGGTINWERCCLGLPALMVQTADNQADNLVQLARRRTGIALGHVQSLTPQVLAPWLARIADRPGLLRRLGARCRQLVDGHGALRVAVAMLADGLSLRTATPDDGPLVWPWRDAESTRRHFTHPEPVPLADHLQWWARSLQARDRWLAIAQVGTRPVGVIRFDLEGDVATASIYLDPLLTGLGLGARLIEAGSHQVRVALARNTPPEGGDRSAQPRVGTGLRGRWLPARRRRMVPGGMTMVRTIVIATPHGRFDALEQTLRDRPGWRVVRLRGRAELTATRLAEVKPEKVILPHWSWIIPAEVHEGFECVIFHMTDLPYGRGGSPLQNLIVRGHRQTQLSALRCTAGLDAGPVYLKRPLSLDGTAEEIFARAAELMEGMVVEIVEGRCTPQPQQGEVVAFQRRQPGQGDIAGLSSLAAVHDHIRMLDADGYPHAFLQVGALRLELTGSRLGDGELLADVRITLANGAPPR